MSSMVKAFRKGALKFVPQKDKADDGRRKGRSAHTSTEPALLKHVTIDDSTPDCGSSTMKGRPILFHRIHSENIQLSLDQRRAKRIESFCKGICFSDRPIAIGERIHLKFAEVSTSWSGVVRVGFTSHDPLTINPAELPRYACPDLTYKPGYWAKALPERYAEQGTTLFYYLTKNGDVMFGINGEEKGIFFSSVATNCNLWALIDIYGNTTCMEFVDGWHLNNLSTNTVLTSGGSVIHQDLDRSFQHLNIIQPTPALPASHEPSSLPALPLTMTSALGSLASQPVRYHLDADFQPMPFHHTMGRHVCLSPDRTTAVRLVHEYCNGYVFSSRPLAYGEKIVIQILSLQMDYSGGLAFGVTSCDPMTLSRDDLPDDSDLLLDRPEYWVVNKDVCTTPEVGDELSFHLTTEGEVRYGKNGHYITTLMYVDKTLPMWAFFDVYGNTQKIHCLGVISSGVQCTQGLTVALPPPRNPAVCSLPMTTTSPPPRPPPPRASPSGSAGRTTPTSTTTTTTSTPPSLPPKQYRLGESPRHPAELLLSSRAAGSPLPPPLVPTPLRPPPTPPERYGPKPPAPPTPTTAPTLTQTPRSQAPPVRAPKPVLPTSPKRSPTLTEAPAAALKVAPQPTSGSDEHCDESCDNESNECKVCMNNAVDCVLYTCGHMCLCYECAQDIKNKHNLCPICRQEIRDIIRIYRS